MTGEECNQRAEGCVVNAKRAPTEPIALEFMQLAAQWRALATRLTYVGPVETHEATHEDARGVGAAVKAPHPLS